MNESVRGVFANSLRRRLARWRCRRNPRVRGSIDGCNGRIVRGWACDTGDCDRTVQIVVELDGRAIASGAADLPRADLAAAGLGKGRHGFELTLDTPVIGRMDVALRLIDADSGKPVRGSERVIELGAVAVCTIDSLGLAGISGRVEASDGRLMEGDVILVRGDGEIVASGPLQHEPAGFSYSIYLPSFLYDGRAHTFEVELANGTSSNAACAVILSAVQTAPEKMADSSRARAWPGLNAIASARYDALREQLRRLARPIGVPTTVANDLSFDPNAAASSQAINVTRAHDRLVAGPASREARQPLQLALPVCDVPQVSIVVPVHDQVALTRHCLASLVLAAGDVSFEVILVDDCSSDETVELGSSIANLVVVRNAGNDGFLHSCNRGASVARGEHLVFLNNDTEVTVGWLEELLGVLSRFPDTGAVGAKLVYPDGRLQDAGGLVWDNGVPWNTGHGGNACAPEYNYVRHVDYLTGAALLVTRVAWDAVGGFCTDYAPAYYEDTDLAFRLRAAGFATRYCPHATVVHYEGGSNGTDTSTGVKRHQLINAELFRTTWSDAFEGLGKEGVDPHLQKDRRIVSRILVIDHAFPALGQDAGSYAAIQEMRLLMALGAKLTFVPHNFEHTGVHVEYLQRLGVECIHAPFFTSVEVFLEHRASEFDAIYVTRYDVAERILPYVRRLTDAPVLFNNADLHFLREMRALLTAGETDLSAPAQTRARELAVMQEVDAILSYNSTEHEIIATHLMRTDRLHECPWVLEPVPRRHGFAAREGIAFVGGFGHPPNAEAVKFFASEVMPLILRTHPQLRFHVWGSRVPDDLCERFGDSVVVEGWAETLDEVFDRCRVFVAPLLSGAGIKGKVLDSIAYGVPAVLSPIAHESTGLVDGTSTFVARSPDEWARQVIALHDDAVLWERVADASAKLAGERYSFAGGLDKMRRVLEATGVPMPDRRPDAGSVGPSSRVSIEPKRGQA